MFKPILIKILLVLNFNLLPSFSFAQDLKYFSISFLGKQIGSIKVREASSADSIVIHIDGKISSSPLKVLNGQFDYKSITIKTNNAASKIHYESNVDATFKERKINYWVKNDRLIAVDVFPKKEKTKLSNPKQVNFEFIDPAHAIAKLLSMPCKNSFAIYDGRRIADLISMKTASKLECRYVYKIRKGPRHLIPLNFKKFEISTFFDQDGNSASKTMTVKAGPFTLILNKPH